MLAAEGLWFIILPMLLFLGSAFFGIWRKKPAWLIAAGVFLVLWIFMMYFFRDPARPKPAEDTFLSPTDGVISAVDTLADGRHRIRIYISIFDVHAVRAPASGEVTAWEFVPGEFLDARDEASADRNQRVNITLDTAEGPLDFSILSGAVARRVLVPLDEGEDVLAGQRIGFIRFGSRSELTLPHGVHASVREGQRVYGGVSVVGETVPEHRPPPEEVLDSIDPAPAGAEPVEALW